jgi:hypothetical protein
MELDTGTPTATIETDDFEVTSNSPVETQAVEPVAPVESAIPAGDEEEPQTEPDPASEAGKALAKKRNSLQARINELTRKAGEREREAQAANERAERLQRELEARLGGQQAQPEPLAQPAAQDFPWPKAEQFDNYDEFVQAQAVAAVRYEMWQAQQAQAVWQQQQQAEYLAQTVREREAAFVAEHPDYYDVVNSLSINPQTPTGQYVLAHLQHSDLGPALAYALGSDPAEFDRIVSLPYGRAIAALGRLEERLDARPATAHSGPVASPNVTQAKPLIKPVSGSPVASDDGEVPDDLSADEHIRRMNARDRARRRR